LGLYQRGGRVAGGAKVEVCELAAEGVVPLPAADELDAVKCEGVTAS